MKLLENFGVSFAFFLIIDLVWLGIIAQPIYSHFLEDFLADSTRWGGAVAFYLLFIVGLNYFALNPALKEKSLPTAMKKGAAYGFFTYMTFELTNYAVIQDWPFGIVPIDILWGTVLALTVTTLSYQVLSRS